MLQKYLTLGEVIAKLKITRRTAYRWIGAGQLMGMKVGGQWRFSPDSFENMLNRGNYDQEPRKKLIMGDFFSGAGGLSEGFHQAGFTSLFGNDFDKDSGATYSANNPEAIFYHKPIQELTAQEILKDVGLHPGELDVLVGGPPCQGFSINAPVRSESDPRNHLFKHYVRIVLEGLQPKVVLFENVPGLLSMGNTLHDVCEAFSRAGYRVKYKLLNAAHYGVPQERWRLLIIGTRLEDIAISFPEPIYYSRSRPNFKGVNEMGFSYAVKGKHSNPELFSWLKDPVNISQAIDDLPKIVNGKGSQFMIYSGVPTSHFQQYAREGAGDTLWNHETAGLTEVNLERFAYVKPGGSWRDIPHELLPAGLKRARRSDHTRRYGRLDPNGLSGTVLTKCDPHWGTFVHYNQDRIISIREAARIQSFPDRFKFLGNLTSQYKQVGNAVPPLLAKAIAIEVYAAIGFAPKMQAKKRELVMSVA
ncbi:MAG: DNA cytosine methyltransferase [Candidatus Peribacter sp.]|nr:DNA cytosine methyltransferase [Candidatus Peribacter sp.]